MIIKDCSTQKKTIKFPKMRNFILDVMKEGRRKNTIYATIEADVTDSFKLIKKYKKCTGCPLSITAFIAWCLSQTINNNKYMHAVRKGKRKITIFEDIDIAFMIEKDVDGIMQPVNYISRSTNKKNIDQLTKELIKCKNEPIGGDWAMNKIEKLFWRQPRWIRNIFWWLSRKFPAIRKEFVGTVGLTSLGMLGDGKITLFPITPMTLTIAVGTTEDKLMKNDGKITKRKMLNITIGVDHDLIDGVPLMRFIDVFKKYLSLENSIPKILIPELFPQQDISIIV